MNNFPRAAVAGIALSILGLLGVFLLVDVATSGTNKTGDVVFLGVLVAIFLGGGVWLTARDLKRHGLRPEFKAAFAGALAGLAGVALAIAISMSLDLSITNRSEGLLVFLVFFAVPCGLAYRWMLQRASAKSSHRPQKDIGE